MSRTCNSDAFAGGVDCAAFMIHLSTSSVKSQCSKYNNNKALCGVGV